VAASAAREAADNLPPGAHRGSCPCARRTQVSHAFLTVCIWLESHPTGPNKTAS
jgi:hypothetical protein